MNAFTEALLIAGIVLVCASLAVMYPYATLGLGAFAIVAGLLIRHL